MCCDSLEESFRLLGSRTVLQRERALLDIERALNGDISISGLLDDVVTLTEFLGRHF